MKLEWLQAAVKPFKVKLGNLRKPHQPFVKVDIVRIATVMLLHPKGHVEPNHEANVHADRVLQGDLN